MKFTRPRCVLVSALAPEGMSAADANSCFNDYVADLSLPLVLFHDHFLGDRGGVALFFVTSPAERDALLSSPQLRGWRVEHRPLIYSFNPAAFDEQIAYTLKSYRSTNWEKLQLERRPSYTNTGQEANSGEEVVESM